MIYGDRANERFSHDRLIRTSKDQMVAHALTCLVEPKPLVQTHNYWVQWKGKSEIDLSELARLRLIEKWIIRRIQRHFACLRTTVFHYLNQLRKNS